MRMFQYLLAIANRGFHEVSLPTRCRAMSGASSTILTQRRKSQCTDVATKSFAIGFAHLFALDSSMQLSMCYIGIVYVGLNKAQDRCYCVGHLRLSFAWEDGLPLQYEWAHVKTTEETGARHSCSSVDIVTLALELNSIPLLHDLLNVVLFDMRLWIQYSQRF